MKNVSNLINISIL